MEPTHALFINDNSDGEGYRYWVLAYCKDSVYYCSSNGKPVIEYKGDEILKIIILDDQKNSAAHLADLEARLYVLTRAFDQLKEMDGLSYSAIFAINEANDALEGLRLLDSEVEVKSS